MCAIGSLLDLRRVGDQEIMRCLSRARLAFGVPCALRTIRPPVHMPHCLLDRRTKLLSQRTIRPINYLLLVAQIELIGRLVLAKDLSTNRFALLQ